MKKVIFGTLILAAILAGILYMIAGSAPSFHTVTKRTFMAREAAGAGLVQRACFSKDSARLLTLFESIGTGTPNKTICLWDLERGKKIYRLQPLILGHQLAISPDNQYFALNGGASVEAQVTLHEAETGEIAAKLDLSHPSGAWDIEFLPDGETAVVLEGFPDVNAKVWRWKENRIVKSFACRGFEMAVSKDGKSIVTGGMASPRHNKNDDKARIWNIQTGALVHELPGHESGATRFAFSPDGAFVATGGSGSESTIRIWDASSGTLVRSIDAYPNEDRAVRGIVYTSAGKRLAVSYGPAKPRPPATLMDKIIYQLQSFLSNNSSSVSMTAPVVVYDCGTWQPLRQYGLNDFNAEISILPDDAGMATVDISGTVRWWDLP